jgi:NitT/TauT family transport system substrate-binding protein
LIENYFEDTDLEIIESSIERYKSQESFAKNPILDQEEWENLQNIMDEAGELPKRVDYNTLVNTEFAEKVMK